MKVRVKVCEFVRQIISIWNNIKFFFSKLFLHFDYVTTKSVFAREFKTVWEMVDFLVFIEVIVNVVFV